jgi:hypothetical protein
MDFLDEVDLCRDCGSHKISGQVSGMVPLNNRIPLIELVEGNLFYDDYYWCEACEDECQTLTFAMGDDVYHPEFSGRIVQITTESLTLQDGLQNFHIVKFPAPKLVYKTEIQ